MTRVTVWPDKYQSGWERTEGGTPLTAVRHGTDGQRLPDAEPLRFPVVDMTTDGLAVYTTDSHCTPYYIRGLNACPRVNAGGLIGLIEAGLDIVFDCIIIDVDAPEHGATGDVDAWCAEQLTLLVPSLLWGTMAWYATRGGLRLMWELPEATSREDYLRLLPRLRHALIEAGLPDKRQHGFGVDPLIDWQRCYRLPHVTRDGVAQSLPLDFARFGLLPELPEAPSAISGDVWAGFNEARVGPFQLPDFVPLGSQDEVLTQYAGALRRQGYAPDMIVDALNLAYTSRFEAAPDGQRPHTMQDFRRIARSVARYEPAPFEARRTGLDSVVVRQGDLPELFEFAAGLLPDAVGVFDRGGELVTVVQSAQPSQGVAEAPRVHPIAEQAMRGILGQRAAWLTPKKTTKWQRDAQEDAGLEPTDFVEVPCDVPKDIAKHVLQRGAWDVQTLQGITETPTLRPDGSVLDVSGYDEATGVMFLPAPGFVWPVVPEAPTEVESVAACGILAELLVDFPFEYKAHRSVMLAAMLTAIARPGIDGPVPLFLLDATTPGSGKGKLAHVVATIATGRSAAVMTQTDPVEMEKRITAILMATAGAGIVLIDNVDKPLGGAALDAVLTANTWQGRVLSESRMITMRNRSLWMATGNNLHIRGDLIRRCLHVRLVPLVERPELTTGFVYPDLLQRVRTHRGRYVSAGLTLLRGYIAAGMPSQGLTPFGGFNAWSALVRSALVWCGQLDPVSTQVVLRANADTTVEAQQLLLQAWSEVFEERATTVRSVLDTMHAQSYGALAGSAINPSVEALREACVELAGDIKGEINSRRLGWALRSMLGRIFDGRRLVRVENENRAGALWKVERVPALAVVS